MVPLYDKSRDLYEKCLDVITEMSGFSREDLLSDSRVGDRPILRFMVWKFVYTHSYCSTSKIGELAGKDHSTIYYGIRAAEDRISLYPSVKEIWERFEQLMFNQYNNQNNEQQS